MPGKVGSCDGSGLSAPFLLLLLLYSAPDTGVGVAEVVSPTAAGATLDYLPGSQPHALPSSHDNHHLHLFERPQS